MIDLFKSPKTQILIIIVLTLFSFSNIFANQLVIDDFDFIVNWSSSHQFDLVSLIKGDQPYGHGGVYRPLRSVLYALYYQLFSTNPTYYHLHSILVHLISTILVFFIVKTLSYDLKLKNSFLITYLPFLTSLLFGLHPIHTEAITYIAASMEMTGVVFFLASFYFYITQRRIISIIFAILAFFTYEMTLTLPFIILAYDFCIRKLEIKRFAHLKRYLPYFFGVIAFFLLKLALTNNLNRGEYLGGSIYLTVLVMAKAFVKYLQLLLWPGTLSLVHILPGNIPTLGGVDLKKELLDKQSFFDPAILLGLILLVGLVFLSFRLVRLLPLISFGSFWFLITLIPVSQIIPLQVAMGEKYLYLPSVGFCLVLGYLSVMLGQKLGLKILTLIILLIVIWFMVLGITRNLDWRTSESIWKDATVKAGGSAAAHYNLANIYQSSERLVEAKQEYLKVLEIDSLYHPALSNLGFVYLSLSDLTAAKRMFEKAIEVRDFYPMHYGLALVYSQEGSFDLALEEYQKVLNLNPSFEAARQAVELINYQKSRIKSLQR